jgi:DNA polymerase-1
MRELKSANYNERSFGERVATNAPLQGSAADIIKLAMIKIDDWLLESGLQTRMVLQVHDELIFEVPPLEEAVVTAKVKELMENAVSLSVPLEVKLSFGKNWGETK